MKKPYLFQVVILDKPRAIAPLQHLISFFRKYIEGSITFWNSEESAIGEVSDEIH